jgi:TRAP-type transport system small permease protein
MRILRHTKLALDKCLEALAVLSIVSMVVVVVIQVYSRFLLPRTPQWTEELTRFLFIATVGFAAGLAVRDNAYVSVDTIVSLFPEKVTRTISILVKVTTIVLMVVIMRYSIPFIRLGTRQLSSSLLIPMAYPFSMTLVSSFLIALYTVLDIVKDVAATFGNPSRKAEGQE